MRLEDTPKRDHGTNDVAPDRSRSAQLQFSAPKQYRQAILKTMTSAEKEALKLEIQASVEALALEIADLEEVTRPIPLDSAIGRVSRMDAINNRSINEAALRTARETQKKLAVTLQNIDRPGFGVCVSCGQAIPQGRMLLKPHATRCVQCASG